MAKKSLLKLQPEEFYNCDGQGQKVFRLRPKGLMEVLSDGDLKETSFSMNPNEDIFTKIEFVPKKKIWLRAYEVVLAEGGKIESILDARPDLDRIESLP